MSPKHRTPKTASATIPQPAASLRYEERFSQHLNLESGSRLADLLADKHVLVVVAGLLQAFLQPEPTGPSAKVLEKQRERGRLRKKLLPSIAHELLKVSCHYQELQGIEGISPELAQSMANEGFRLLTQNRDWTDFHNEKRLGLTHNWIFGIVLEEFVKLWNLKQGQPYQLTPEDWLRLATAADRAHNRADVQDWVPDDLRGLAHFRANPGNGVLCGMAHRNAIHLVTHLDNQPYLILRKPDSSRH